MEESYDLDRLLLLFSAGVYFSISVTKFYVLFKNSLDLKDAEYI